jgi:hypothetical protein
MNLTWAFMVSKFAVSNAAVYAYAAGTDAGVAPSLMAYCQVGYTVGRCKLCILLTHLLLV